jgi:hypothetical protein
VAYRRESDRTLRDGSFEVALFQALRARLRSDRPSGTEPLPSGIKPPKHFLSSRHSAQGSNPEDKADALPTSEELPSSRHSLAFSVKNRQQLAGPARSHKIVHPLLRVGKFIEALGIDHNDCE